MTKKSLLIILWFLTTHMTCVKTGKGKEFNMYLIKSYHEITKVVLIKIEKENNFLVILSTENSDLVKNGNFKLQNGNEILKGYVIDDNPKGFIKFYFKATNPSDLENLLLTGNIKNQEVVYKVDTSTSRQVKILVPRAEKMRNS